ncbi:MAG: tyrosine-type recombinase/integrase [Pirellula sp.]
MCSLMYGGGLRVMEACRLRVKDIDFDRKQIMVREGKGEKDRAVPLPQRLISPLKHQIELITKLHQQDPPRRSRLGMDALCFGDQMA